MKNKSAVLFVLGLMAMSGVAYGAASVRGAKTVTAFVSSSVQTVTKAPAAVYAVVLGTGAVTDYVVLFDSANATAVTVASNGLSSFRGKYYASSATANTQITFDPPLQFVNGITAVSATALVPTIIVWESGRVTQGN